MPWAAIYDRRLDTADPTRLQLCPGFQACLAADAKACDAACPVDPRQKRNYVCPLGFWGIRHEVEQPLKQVTPTPVGERPPELDVRAFSEAARIPVRPSADDGFVVYDAQVDPGAAHVTEIGTLLWGVKPVTDGYGFRDALETGAARAFYVLCHGEIDPHAPTAELCFRLAGPSGDVSLPASAVFDDGDYDPFLVFFNACDSSAITPEVAHTWMEKLQDLGAIGVIGTEVKVRTAFAKQVASAVFGSLREGHTLGRAFLDLRRARLRDALDPSGLLYSFHASADLHFHPTEGCGVCSAG